MAAAERGQGHRGGPPGRPAPNERKRYWFPVGIAGWGWGAPVAWQGWAVLALYVAGVAVLCNVLHEPLHVLGGLAGLSLVLVAVAWMKGEPQSRRWDRRG